jgi:predicted DNA-binding transcriptional regulator AlpA
MSVTKKSSKSKHSAFVARAAAIKDADVVGLRLLSKPEVIAITGASFVTIWTWMRDGKFPHARIAGGRSMWRSDEIDAWLAGLPIRPLKGDAPTECIEAAE